MSCCADRAGVAVGIDKLRRGCWNWLNEQTGRRTAAAAVRGGWLKRVRHRDYRPALALWPSPCRCRFPPWMVWSCRSRLLEAATFWLCSFDWVSMDDISPQMALAVMAAEDQKFPDHWGFDVAVIEKALSHNEKRPTRIRGASTLSQQTAKNLFLWDGRSWLRSGWRLG